MTAFPQLPEREMNRWDTDGETAVLEASRTVSR